MATQFQAMEAIIKAFLDSWRSRSNPSQFETPFDLDEDSAKFTPPKNQAWVRPNVQFNIASKTGIGKIRRNARLLREGQVVFQIFTPYENGVKQSSELSEKLLSGLEGRKIHIDDGSIVFYGGTWNFLGDEGTSNQSNVTIPFTWRDNTR